MIALAPIRRDASTVWTRWFADGEVDRRHTGDVDHDDAGTVRLDCGEELLGQLPGTRGVEAADDRQDEQPLTDLQHGRRQLPDRLLLDSDDAFALLDETHADRDRDAVGRRLVGVEDAVQQVRVGLVPDEKGASQDVAQEQHDAEHFVRLDAARDDPLGQVPGVGLQRLDAAVSSAST
jgi:hypothetical protein